ncbi:hypothetical protein LguiA_015815 [Lonicera macranthoides]
MPPNMKTLLFITLLVLVCSSSGTEGSSHGINHASKDTNPHNEVIYEMKVRKLKGVNAMLDYYEGGSNPVHDPGKGKGRSGNNN